MWGIAGPSADALEPFGLFGFGSGLLEPGTVLAAPARQSPLPPQSEGLVIDGTRALVVIDGAIGGPLRTRCDQPSLQRTVALP